MSKKLLTLLLGSFLLTNGLVLAEAKTEKERGELQAVKMQQVKLKTQERLIHLRQALKLKDSQMSVWANYEKHLDESITDTEIMVKKLRKKNNETGKPPTSVELAKLNVVRLENKLKKAKKQLNAFTDLYNILDDTQKQTIDKMARKKIKREAKKVRQLKN